VRGSIDFWDDLDTSKDCIVDNLFDVTLTIGFFSREGTVFAQVRVRGDINGEGITVSNVPVENVELN